MTQKYMQIALLVLVCALPAGLAAQSYEPDSPLGDVARSYRKEKKMPDRAVIDNENMLLIMDDIQKNKMGNSLLFSFDNGSKSFQVSSPDVTCSLSFTGKTGSLLSDPYLPRDLPLDQLEKLGGPAVLEDGSLRVSLFNGSNWSVREITVGITLIRRNYGPKPIYGPVMLQPASERIVETPQRSSDQTVLYHLKGSIPPSITSDLSEAVNLEPEPDQEWHWAIVSAKGVPPAKPVDPSLPPFPGEQASPVSPNFDPTGENLPD